MGGKQVQTETVRLTFATNLSLFQRAAQMADGKKFGEHLLDFVKSDDDFLAGRLSVKLLRAFLEAQGGCSSVKGPVDYILFKETEERSLLRATRSLGAHASGTEDKASLSAKWHPHWSDEESRVRDQATSPPPPGRLGTATGASSNGRGKVSPKGSRTSGYGTWKRNADQVAGDVFHGRIDKRQRKWPRILQDTQEKGLWNKNNMCYRNSILSCLLHQPTIYHYLKNVGHQCGRPRYQCTLCALKFLMKEYWSFQHNFAGPRAARRDLDHALISDLEPGDAMEGDFLHERQSDAYDFAQHLISKLRNKEAPHSDAHIDSLFNLTHQQQWTCQDCGAISVGQTISDTGLSLRTDAPRRGLRLQDYVKHFLDYTQSIRCESEACQKKHNYDSSGSSGRKRSTGRSHAGFDRHVTKAITTVPELLCIKLDRAYSKWGVNPKTRLYEKQEEYKMVQPVPFEERLDLTNYRSDGSKEKLLYRLDGVSAHCGQLGSGHYIAVVRGWHQQHAGTTFWTINDSRPPVQGANFSSMQKPIAGRNRFDPFVLFYSRLHPGDPDYEEGGSSQGEKQAAEAVASDTKEQKTNGKKTKRGGIMDDPANFDLDEDIAAELSGRPRKRSRR
ncbi:cysteine proteinase [Teratosphaeria nubilosa]|uniref:ubiquitinyl hydrolase 1 n=1 Tax=Teratosphaeria nubilosa TaxID=161662 RepID=A0A6G1KWT5_9PEZI|nr:cysteine proteinase [Teratosphaeria nubilosa]